MKIKFPEKSLENTLVSAVVVFDADTGDVVQIHEEYKETTGGKGAKCSELSDDECEKIRAETARLSPRRRVDAMNVPPEILEKMSENDGLNGVRLHVDLMTRKLRLDPDHQCSLDQLVRLASEDKDAQ